MTDWAPLHCPECGAGMAGGFYLCLCRPELEWIDTPGQRERDTIVGAEMLGVDPDQAVADDRRRQREDLEHDNRYLKLTRGRR